MNYRRLQERLRSPGFFWTPPDQVRDDELTVFGEEARHMVTVCRLGVGEMVTVCDGEGNAYDCEILRATSREVVAGIVRAHRHLGEPMIHLTLAAGVGQPSNFDWIVEKSVELGVARIVPVRAAQSPASIGGEDAARRRTMRWRRLTLGAMKQSLRSCRPPVDDIIPLADLGAVIEEHQYTLLADPDGKRVDPGSQTSNRVNKALLIVGPESGFTADERRFLLDRGAVPFSLGARRLRAETAAVTALVLLMRELGEI